MSAREVIELVGIDWVERRLNRDRSSINRYIKAGKFEAPTWIGNRRCWTIAQVERFVAAEQDRHRRFNLPTIPDTGAAP